MSYFKIFCSLQIQAFNLAQTLQESVPDIVQDWLTICLIITYSRYLISTEWKRNDASNMSFYVFLVHFHFMIKEGDPRVESKYE